MCACMYAGVGSMMWVCICVNDGRYIKLKMDYVNNE